MATPRKNPKDRVLTPQQEKFLKNFLDYKSETWGNYYKSAKKAGYAEEYAQNISGQMPDWLLENISDEKLAKKALKNLEIALDGGLDPEEGAKNIQWKATDTTLKAFTKQFADKKQIDITSQGEKIQGIEFIFPK